MEVFRTEEFYVLLCGESSLWINKGSGELEIKPAWELANGQDPECMGVFFGLIGQIKCPVLDNCILLVKESVLVGELPSGHAVHKIKSIAMLNPLLEACPDLNLRPCSKHHRAAYDAYEQSMSNSTISKTWSSLKTATSSMKTSSQHTAPSQTTNQNRKEAKERERYQRRIKEELHRIFTDTDSFYFCPAGGDITNTMYKQHLYTEKHKGSKNVDILDNVDDRFFWNKHMLQDIINIDSPLAKVWIMPIIQGYVEIKQCKMFFKENQKYELFTISLISRRSRHRVGTRYKRRGLDEHGHCANYVETEQILQYKSHVVSFVLIRGSIPLFWSQQGLKYRPPPQLHRSYEENQVAFEKHLDEEIERYGPIVIINLVERTGKEAVVGDAYSDHLCTFNSENITYVTFDLHHYCRGMKFENVSRLIDEIQDEISKMNYCWVDNQGLISSQNGTFRVNCIDCLDRTNLVQTSIAREVMMSQLIKLGLMSPEAPNNLISITQQMWANNGDVISKQYAGTNALKGDITRTGNRKISGLMKDGMNSANRYFRKHYADHYTQICLDIMQGQSADFDNPLVTLVHSASPLFDQLIPSKCPVTFSTENFVFGNELRILAFIFLLSRYYLSRFKDSTRQATLDIMLGKGYYFTKRYCIWIVDTLSKTMITFLSISSGNPLEDSVMQQKDSSEEEDEEDGSVNEEDSQITIEHIKQVIDDVKKLLIEDPSSVIAAWALLNADYQSGLEVTSSATDIDTILVLTRSSCFIADYDSELDKVTRFQEIRLENLKSIDLLIGNDGFSSPSSMSPVQSQKCSPSKSTQPSPILTLNYTPKVDKPSFVLHYAFKSTNLRFFNNIAVTIKSDEEKVESLRAIAETIQVAYEVYGLGELEIHVKLMQQKGLLSKQFQTSDVQFSSLRNVGSKALSNVSQQFSKFNKFGQNFKFNRNKTKNVTESEMNSSIATSPSQEAFLPTAGIVLSNTNIESAMMVDPEISNPQIVVENTSAASSMSIPTESFTKLEKSQSSDRVNVLGSEPSEQNFTAEDISSNKDLSLNLMSVVHEGDNALQSLRSGFASATNALVSPSSPLSRLAKGVQNLSTNLDPRRLRGVERSNETLQISENIKVKEKWSTSGCKSKLIAL